MTLWCPKMDILTCKHPFVYHPLVQGEFYLSLQWCPILWPFKGFLPFKIPIMWKNSPFFQTPLGYLWFGIIQEFKCLCRLSCRHVFSQNNFYLAKLHIITPSHIWLIMLTMGKDETQIWWMSSYILACYLE
jgi:hypothetical protein